jgi:DNA helicase-2/ATP-dependent DNA helicase PcrA
VQSSGSAPLGGGLATRSAQGPTGTDGRPLRVGQGVFHNKFGEGVIVTLEGSGTDARAQVNFGRHGMKWLALSVAKLTPVD